MGYALCAKCKTPAFLLDPRPKSGYSPEKPYCPECKAYYCYTHLKVTGFLSYAPGVDHQYRNATCPKGHTFTYYED